jgi:hypothetical protein
MTGCKNVLGFVTCHFLSEYTIEEVSEVMMMVGQHKWGGKWCFSSQPHALNVILSNFHIYINGPEVPSLRMRIDDTLKKRLAPLRFAQSVLQLCELGDGLEVWRRAARIRELGGCGANTATTDSSDNENLRLRFSKLCRLLGRSFRACSTSPRFR